MIETVILALIAAAPAITAVAGIVIAVTKLVKAFNDLKAEVVNTKQFEELKVELNAAHQENRELKKKLNQLLTKIDHIQRKEDE